MTDAQQAAERILELDDVHTYYGSIHALKGVTLHVDKGEIVTHIGSNGAGKSTTLKTISGITPARQGSVRMGGDEITRTPAHEIVRRGVGHAPEGRRVFSRMTVYENLQMGAFTRKGSFDGDVARVFELFPRLKERRTQKAGTLSGGEQQMLAIGRALMTEPELMMLDEPSLGLAPRLVSEIFEIVRRLNQELGTTILIVEQNARLALDIADYAYIMENGRIVLDGPAGELAENPDVQEFYLGMTESGERRSYREVKHYRRRKRWL
jgi:branched-chain amino acid transport system ATP-binding protein